ncbi:MAG: NAAT family transporter [Rhodospirillales bacterium]|nr:NAAT family transporter [Rhodospirillales bacterium]
MLETALVAFTTFFATVGPIDVAAIFAGLTAGMPAKNRRTTALKGVGIAALILLMFAFFGAGVLASMGITLAALKTSGGILLLLIGINMVLAHPSGINSTTADEAEEATHRQDISVFPLATPLIAGPGAIGAMVLFMAKHEGNIGLQATVIGALVAVLVLTLVCLLMATQLQRVLGVTGLNVISRIVGVLLTALAVQFIFDGISASGLLGELPQIS